MWNSVAEIIQDKSTKRLAFAIIVSAVIHAYLVGGFDVSLPTQHAEMRSIEARLQMPNVAVKALIKEPLIEEVSNQAAPITDALPPATQPDLQPNIDTHATDLTAQDTATQNLNASTPNLEVIDLSPPQVALSDNIDSSQTETQPVDANLVLNENAYRYVETEFDVRTEIDGEPEGAAKIVFDLSDDKQYKLTSVIKPHGLAALIVSDLLQTSAGQVTESGLQPTDYLYQYGDKVDKTYSAKFDWLNKTVSLTTAKGTKTEEITEGTQDLLSFMYQFMYVAPLERMQINIATGKKLASYDYSFSGEENINTPIGQIKTIHILHQSEHSDEKTELWLAVDYQYLPVKIRKIEKNGKVYELVARLINTTRPTLN